MSIPTQTDDRRAWVRDVWARWERATDYERRWLPRLCVDVFDPSLPMSGTREEVLAAVRGHAPRLAAPAVEILGDEARQAVRRHRELTWGIENVAAAGALTRRIKRELARFDKEWA